MAEEVALTLLGQKQPGGEVTVEEVLTLLGQQQSGGEVTVEVALILSGQSKFTVVGRRVVLSLICTVAKRLRQCA